MNHASKIFRDFNFFNETKLIFTIDITSLSTVISNNEGLQALKNFVLTNVPPRNLALKHFSI